MNCLTAISFANWLFGPVSDVALSGRNEERYEEVDRPQRAGTNPQRCTSSSVLSSPSPLNSRLRPSILQISDHSNPITQRCAPYGVILELMAALAVKRVARSAESKSKQTRTLDSAMQIPGTLFYRQSLSRRSLKRYPQIPMVTAGFAFLGAFGAWHRLGENWLRG